METCFTKENIRQKLEEAIRQKLVFPWYQPKFDAVTERVNGAEALARWRDSDGSLISPAAFIPLLEETGDIVQLDWYILDCVCELLRKSIDQDGCVVPISSNFSRAHIREVDFGKKLCEHVDRYGIPHHLIEVEITESSLVGDRDDILTFVGQIRDAGFPIAIDDFGSGLSSLYFVKDIPASVLKIDKSLISGNCEQEKERIVLESIFTFSHRLKMTVVAEGVETKEQLSFLRTCGCETIQGFYFSKPLPEDEFFQMANTGDACRVPSDLGDILEIQSQATAAQLLLNAVFEAFPLIMMNNLTRNTYYMMNYGNFSTTCCPSTGVYTEGIVHGTSTMHPDDRELFAKTFDRDTQLAAYEKGERVRRVVTRQLGDDGVYRKIETTNYYMKNPAVDDVLAITLCRAI